MSEAFPTDPLDWLEAEYRRPGGPRVELRRQLTACADELIGLAAAVHQAIPAVTEAFLGADAHAAEAHATTDARIRAGCRQLEEACFLLLARQGPVGGDLRRIVAIARCLTNVERASNLLRHVAGSLTWVHPPALSAALRTTLAELAGQAEAVFGGAVQAWRDFDGLAAVELQQADDEVDLLHKILLTELYMGQQSTEESVSLALIARYFERIGDHGVEMARQVTYAVTGTRAATERRSAG